MVIICTRDYNIKNFFHFLHKVYLGVSYYSRIDINIASLNIITRLFSVLEGL
jgi:hypothetical protein